MSPIVKSKLCLCLMLTSGSLFSQTQDIAQDSVLSPAELKKMSLEELMNTEVTSVSMRPEKLTEVASAIQVLKHNDIKRSSATRLPEALRLASNLQISQANSHDWAITARGFSGVPSAGGIVANKLLVLIDGRSVYTPLFGGVHWDTQNVMLEDVDRIEVVSGPGGTLWGANAVNGVINVVSKSAKETQGFYVSGALGTFLEEFGEVRYGGRIDSNIFFRVYGQAFKQESAILSGKVDDTISNAWNSNQRGFRMDAYPTDKTSITLQGDFYDGDANSETKFSVTNGRNILARATHNFSDKSDLKVQLYYDHAFREIPNTTNKFLYEIDTYDLDFHHRFPLGKSHDIVWGGGYRLQKDKTAQTFNPLNREMPLYQLFIQDEIAFIPNRLTFTVGSKFLHNDFTGFEISPSAKVAWTPNNRHTIWTAVSRAVRTPSRFDSDIIVDKPFDSEKMDAYELGYRVRPVDELSISLATFYNEYDSLRSIDLIYSPSPKIIIANSQWAKSKGVELSFNFQATSFWRLRGGYTYFENQIFAKHSNVQSISPILESVDPKNMIVLQSILDLPCKLQLDFSGRYVGALPAAGAIPKTEDYTSLDARLAYQSKYFTVSFVGQNLLANQRTETGLSIIPRSFYTRITCQF